MKRVLLLLVLFCSILYFKGNAQIYFESFSSTQLKKYPLDWIVASNTSVAEYYRPALCSSINQGLQTPGVGQSAPTGFVLPSFTKDPANTSLIIRFKVYVYNSQSQGNPCSANVNDFPCPVAVNAYLVPTNLPNNYNPTTIPPTNYYAQLPEYKILDANAENSIIFNDLPADLTSFRVQLVFKAVSLTNCSNTGIKYVFDDISVAGARCQENVCGPVSSNDYFNTDVQNLLQNGATAFKGNVYGGYALWSNQAPVGFENHSLEFFPAVNNGIDYDLKSTNLSEVTFAKVGSLKFEAGPACVGTPSNIGDVTLNPDGTFTFTRGMPCVTRVSFTYSLTTNQGTSNAQVFIDLPGNNASLPVSFSNFNAQRIKQQVSLKWETATEQNNRGFYIQRNTKGVWENIAFVFSAADRGNSNSQLSYSYQDVNNIKGISQYRIQQVDMDGRASYSVIRSVKGEEQVSKTVVYPNPSNDGKVNVVFEDQGAKAVTVSDLSGRVVRQYRNVINNLLIDGLESGMYSIQITDLSSAASTTEKVIIKKR